MSKASSAAAQAPKVQRLKTARRALQRPAQGRVGPSPRIPRKASPDRAFLIAAVNQRKCAAELIRAITAHAQFSAANPYDDAGHADQHQRVISARQAYNGAIAAFDLAAADLGISS